MISGPLRDTDRPFARRVYDDPCRASVLIWSDYLEETGDARNTARLRQQSRLEPLLLAKLCGEKLGIPVADFVDKNQSYIAACAARLSFSGLIIYRDHDGEFMIGLNGNHRRIGYWRLESSGYGEEVTLIDLNRGGVISYRSGESGRWLTTYELLHLPLVHERPLSLGPLIESVRGEQSAVSFQQRYCERGWWNEL